MAAGRVAEACPKFAESNKLEPGAGTLLNLAACNEQLGKTATAWSQFSEAFHLLATDEQRAAFAQQHRDDLAAKLSKLTIQVPKQAQVPGLVVTMDGIAVGDAAWGNAMPIDPGPHKLEASANGYKTWDGDVQVGATSDSASITIPTLESTAPAPAPSGATAGAQSDVGGEAKMGGRPITTPVIIAGAATIALAAGAGITGGLYLGKKSSYDEINGKPGADPAEIQSRKDSLDSMGTVNLVFTGGAIAGAAATLILYFTTPKETTTAFVPWIDRTAAGATLWHRF
ncbi:MAG TPA: hypothetical protein VL137_16945 [Polyangiaceae bacterium]|nr:hypothetical protein [Polyangiaceae bacterium]